MIELLHIRWHLIHLRMYLVNVRKEELNVEDAGYLQEHAQDQVLGSRSL